MMAASSGFPPGSGGSRSAPSTSHASASTPDDEFGSFAAAERLSDPFGDVYGAEADFGDFVGGSSGPEDVVPSGAAADASSLMFFSPVTAPAPPPTLLPSISGELDPFADITGGLRAANAEEATEKGQEDGPTELDAVAAPPTSTSSATSAILDLVWGKESELNPLATSTGASRTASSPGGFMLPPPPSSRAASFPTTRTPETSTDLLSFSPVQAASKDPFIGISNESDDDAFGDELFTLTTTPMSTTSSSAPTSLRGSFASLHEEVKPMVSPTVGVENGTTSPRDPFEERTMRSFGSLNSSFVSVGTMEDTSGRNGANASFNTFTAAFEAISTTPSPSSAPASLRSSFKMTDGFMGFAATADESNEVDPFAEAGLAAPEEVPLVEALAAWNTSADPVVETDVEDNEIGDEEQRKAENSALCEEKLSEVSVHDDAEAVVGEGRSNDQETFASSQFAVTEVEPLDVWDSSATSTPDPDDEHVDDSLVAEQQQVTDVSAINASATGVEYERQSIAAFTESTEVTSSSERDDNTNVLVGDENEDEARTLGFQNCGLDDDESDSDEDDVLLSTDSDVVWPAEQSMVQSNGDFSQNGQGDSLDYLTTARKVDVEGIDETQSSGEVLSNDDSSPSTSAFSTSFDISTPAPAELPPHFEKFEGDFVGENNTKDNDVQDDGVDDFGGFGGFEAAAAPTTSVTVLADASPWGSFPSPTPVQNMPVEDDDTAFGDFAVAESSSAVELSAPAVTEDDGFADFAPSTEPSGDDEVGDFGDFTQSAIVEGFSDFEQSNSEAFGDDDGFGDFTSAATAAAASSLSTMPATSFSKTDLTTFFEGAFPVENLQPDPLPQPNSPTDVNTVIQEPTTDFVRDVFRTMWEEYFGIIATTSSRPSTSSGSLSSTSASSDVERVRLGRKATRASKYLKYVLSEKIQEASRQNGIFPHGSERHEMYIGLATSGDADHMRAALKELQDALFHSSVNEAMMRIAKQAALSAKAKIAEQAAQQQANSRGGSLFSTTRHLLSRGGSAGGAHGPSSGNDSKADHTSTDTPTGASVQKLARFSFANSHDDTSNDHRAASGDERGSEGSDHTGHSSESDSEAVGGANDSRTRSQTLSGSGGTSGGLMKKFQDRFSFASSRHRPRFVCLRRKGQSGEEVRKMELNLDAISGGLDEVKWKCAMFLYDVEEVAHVAPSQISILSYPGKQPLTGKTDRSALTKLVKPETIWTVDIGANNSDMLNEW